jgi:hypothetical protein
MDTVSDSFPDRNRATGSLLLHGQMGQEGVDLRLGHLGRVADIVEEDEALHPVPVRLFRRRRRSIRRRLTASIPTRRRIGAGSGSSPKTTGGPIPRQKEQGRHHIMRIGLIIARRTSERTAARRYVRDRWCPQRQRQCALKRRDPRGEWRTLGESDIRNAGAARRSQTEDVMAQDSEDRER